MLLPQSNTEAALSEDRQVLRYLERREKEGLSARNAVRLMGDASTRTYYRVYTDAGSLVLALMPESFDPGSLAFLNVAELLRAIPLRIPVIHHVSGREGILLLEDLGDELLQKRVNDVDRAQKLLLYREAVSILVRLQTRGAELRDKRFFPYRFAFDEVKLFEELAFFEKHFVVGLRQSTLSGEEREALYRAFRAIASELASRPRVLCHRDYHSRNLMVTKGELAVIDFQDARMGPVSYDLVSLLRDSYVEHDLDFVAEMIEEFRRGTDSREFESEFDLMALQRNLKALGTFGFQISVNGNDVYGPYVPTTLEMVRRNLAGSARWDGLRKTLSRHLPEVA